MAAFQYLKKGEILMKITCSRCGAEFDVDKTGGNVCPYCGYEVPLASSTQDDEFFGDINGETYQPVQPTYEPVPTTYHAAFDSDAKANKSARSVFSIAVFLLVIGALRFVVGLTSVASIGQLVENLPSYVGTIYYAPIKAYIGAAYSEIALHVAIFACAIALVVFVSKTKNTKFPTPNDAVFATYKKSFIAYCVMVGVLAVYSIVEIVALVVTIRLEKVLDEVILSPFMKVAVIVWVVVLLAAGIVGLVNSLKLSKKAD